MHAHVHDHCAVVQPQAPSCGMWFCAFPATLPQAVNKAHVQPPPPPPLRPNSVKMEPAAKKGSAARQAPAIKREPDAMDGVGPTVTRTPPTGLSAPPIKTEPREGGAARPAPKPAPGGGVARVSTGASLSPQKTGTAKTPPSKAGVSGGWGVGWGGRLERVMVKWGCGWWR